MSIEQNQNSGEVGKVHRDIPSARIETHSQVSADQTEGWINVIQDMGKEIRGEVSADQSTDGMICPFCGAEAKGATRKHWIHVAHSKDCFLSLLAQQDMYISRDQWLAAWDRRAYQPYNGSNAVLIEQLSEALTDCAKRMEKLRELLKVSGAPDTQWNILDTKDARAALALAHGKETGKCHDCKETKPLREYEKDNLAGTDVLHIEICEDCYKERTE